MNGAVGVVTYSLQGFAGSEQMFRINPTSGRVTVRGNITADDADSYVMYLIATDEAGKTGRAQLTVDVNRNLHAPELQPPLNREVNIPDNQSPGIIKAFSLSLLWLSYVHVSSIGRDNGIIV